MHSKRTDTRRKQAYDGSDETALLLQLRQHVDEVVTVTVVSFGIVCGLVVLLLVVVAIIVVVGIRTGCHLVGCGGCHATTTAAAASTITD